MASAHLTQLIPCAQHKRSDCIAGDHGTAAEEKQLAACEGAVCQVIADVAEILQMSEQTMAAIRFAMYGCLCSLSQTDREHDRGLDQIRSDQRNMICAAAGSIGLEAVQVHAERLMWRSNTTGWPFNQDRAAHHESVGIHQAHADGHAQEGAARDNGLQVKRRKRSQGPKTNLTIHSVGTESLCSSGEITKGRCCGAMKRCCLHLPHRARHCDRASC